MRRSRSTSMSPTARWSAASTTPTASSSSCRSRARSASRPRSAGSASRPASSPSFRAEARDATDHGYVVEHYGALSRLPEPGRSGANGLATPPDFLSPVAAVEDRGARTERVVKVDGDLWATDLGHSPLDVVAWHGN